MMGGNHAASGAAAWIAVAARFEIPLGVLLAAPPAWLPSSATLGFGLLDVRPAGVLAGALVCAGAALVPDADHRHATIAQSLPPVSNALCAGIGKVAGGHRKGTHSLAGLVGFVVVAWLVGLWTVETGRFGTVYPGAGILGVLLVAFAAKALRFIPDTMRKFPWVVGLVFGAFIACFAPEDQRWFVVAVGLGVAVHLAGDMLTTGGCNLLWPVRWRRPRFLRRMPVVKDVWRPNGNVAVPLLGNAGSWREWLLAIPVAGYALAGIVAAATAMGASGYRLLTGMLTTGW